MMNRDGSPGMARNGHTASNPSAGNPTAGNPTAGNPTAGNPTAGNQMTSTAPAVDPRLRLFDELYRYELRAAAGEVAAAIAHAMGTPLNVVSGRAELIRQDPSKATAQATRIEEQVRNMAAGLRQLVDYLTPPETNVLSAEAGDVLNDVLSLMAPLARAQGVELAATSNGLASVHVPRWHVLSTLTMLTSIAVQSALAAPSAVVAEGAEACEGAGKRLGLRASSSGTASSGSLVVFELDAPGLEAAEGWQLDKFSARPLPANVSDHYRLLAICAATVRGNGGKLAIEANGSGVLIRFSCKPSASA